jgi:hypothetical protein
MRKIFTFFLLASIFLIVKPTLAQSSTPKKIRDENRQVRQEVKTTIVQVRQEKRAALTEAKQKRIQTHFENIQDKLTKRHNVLIKIKNKIEARIIRNPGNKDVTQAKSDLSKFNELETKYQTDMTNLTSKFNELKTSEKPSELIKDLKSYVYLVRTDLDNIKQLLVKTTTDLAQAPKLTITPTPNL